MAGSPRPDLAPDLDDSFTSKYWRRGRSFAGRGFAWNKTAHRGGELVGAGKSIEGIGEVEAPFFIYARRPQRG